MLTDFETETVNPEVFQQAGVEHTLFLLVKISFLSVRAEVCTSIFFPFFKKAPPYAWFFLPTAQFSLTLRFAIEWA